MSDDTDNDPIGFGRPPKSGQFKPGQSGNPRGRKAKQKRRHSDGMSPTVADDVIDELGQVLIVRENGREKKISKQRAFVIALVNSAIKGDVRAINAVVALAKNFGATNAENDSSDDDDSVGDLKDLEVLETFVARERARLDRHSKDSNSAPADTADSDVAADGGRPANGECEE